MFLIGILENALKNTEQNNIYALKKLKKMEKTLKNWLTPKKVRFRVLKKKLNKILYFTFF